MELSVNKIFLSYLTVDLVKYQISRINTKCNEILYVGSLIKRKGIDLLLNALSKVEMPYHLSIIGNGIEKENLIKLASKYDIIDKVSFWGFLEGDDLRKKYAESTVFVLPTREDCYGLVVLEAMCASLPIVCSKYADGVYDLIDDGKNGFIIDPYNEIEFSEAITTILKDKLLAQEFSNESSEKLSQFSFKEVAKEIIKALDSVKTKV